MGEMDRMSLLYGGRVRDLGYNRYFIKEKGLLITENRHIDVSQYGDIIYTNENAVVFKRDRMYRNVERASVLHFKKNKLEWFTDQSLVRYTENYWFTCPTKVNIKRIYIRNKDFEVLCKLEFRGNTLKVYDVVENGSKVILEVTRRSTIKQYITYDIENQSLQVEKKGQILDDIDKWLILTIPGRK